MRSPGKSQLLRLPAPRRLAAVVICTYLAVVFLVAMFQRWLIYFPSRTFYATPADAGLEYEEVWLTTSDGVRISAWLVPHAEARATILFVHGNAGNIGDRVDALRTLHSFGVNVLIVDYRGYGKSEGRPSEAGTYRDATAAWDYLTGVRGLPASSIILFGESLGGAVAIDLALRHPPGALVVQSTFTSMADVAAIHYPYLPVRWMVRHEYDSVAKVGRITCSKLFIHSTGDTLIPLANGKALFEAAAEPKRLMLTPGDHNEGGFQYSREFTRQLGEFLDSVVQAGGQ